MVVDAMTEGSLAPGARGISTIEKVRLMHAAIRLLILNRPGHDWPTDQRGLPINQEDMAGTLMTFSYLAIDGLKHLGIRLNRADRESYVAAWAYVGRRMGVDRELIPKSFKEAKRLTRRHSEPPDRPLRDEPRHAAAAAGRSWITSRFPVWPRQRCACAFPGRSPTASRYRVTGSWKSSCASSPGFWGLSTCCLASSRSAHDSIDVSPWDSLRVCCSSIEAGRDLNSTCRRVSTGTTLKPDLRALSTRRPAA